MRSFDHAAVAHKRHFTTSEALGNLVVFVFLDRADIEATNYPAEQDIRIAVVNRKTCGGGNRTAKGAQAQSILMSVLQSCRHKGIRVIDIVTSILRAPDNTPVPLVNPER